MKTKLILLTAVLAVTAAHAAAPQGNRSPLWEGDRPGSFMRRQTDPVYAAMSIQQREQMQLSPAGRAQLNSDKAEYNAYVDWARKQPKR